MLSHTQSTAEFSKLLNETLHHQGITQVKLSDQSGIGRKSVGKYCRAEVVPSPKTVAALNAVLFPSERSADIEPDQADKIALVDASIESIVEELKNRGFKQVTLSAG